jgi:hypothetical protein
MDRHYDYESIAIARASHDDPYGQSNEKTLIWKNRAKIWLLRCAMKARNYDIIHIHSGIRWIPIFRQANKTAKIVIHLHGTKIRGRWDEFDLTGADMVLVSTKDLLDGAPDRVMWLPNPVDEEKIEKVKRVGAQYKKIEAAFHVDRYARAEAEVFSLDHDIDISVFDRDVTPLRHHRFLGLMNEYTHFIDVKRDFPGHINEAVILKAFSMSGLEALALGCKVIDWKGEIHEGLPDLHRSEKVAETLHGFYQWGWKET